MMTSTHYKCVLVSECLFGRAPFASRSIEELELKIKDTKPIEVQFIQ